LKRQKRAQVHHPSKGLVPVSPSFLPGTLEHAAGFPGRSISGPLVVRLSFGDNSAKHVPVMKERGRRARGRKNVRYFKEKDEVANCAIFSASADDRANAALGFARPNARCTK